MTVKTRIGKLEQERPSNCTCPRERITVDMHPDTAARMYRELMFCKADRHPAYDEWDIPPRKTGKKFTKDRRGN